MPLMIEQVNSRAAELVDGIAIIYAQNFTVAELRDVTSFYRTPTGQKLLEKFRLSRNKACSQARNSASPSSATCGRALSKSCASADTISDVFNCPMRQQWRP